VVSIVIVNFNTRDLLRSCLNTIPLGAKDLSHEVIVVDNGSTDGSAEMIKTHFPQVKMLKNEENLGFSRASNLGAATSRGDALLFLNSDTLVREKAISLLYDTLMTAEDIGIVGPKIVNPKGVPTRSYMRFLTLPMLFAGSEKLSRFINVEKFRLHFDQYDFSRLREVPWVSGACLMIKSKIFTEIGGFDEGYFFYCEDMDLCLQAQRRGYRVIFNPQAEIVHLFGGSSGEKRAFLNREYQKSVFHYFRKHYSPFHAWTAKLIMHMKGYGR